MLTEGSRPRRQAPWEWNADAKPRRCRKCGTEFMPRSRTAAYCDECRKAKKGERSR